MLRETIAMEKSVCVCVCVFVCVCVCIHRAAKGDVKGTSIVLSTQNSPLLLGRVFFPPIRGNYF